MQTLIVEKTFPNIAVLIPAWQPGPQLIELVSSLLKRGITLIIIVDDGSRPESQAIFSELRSYSSVVVLRHASNMGKGRSLKYGLHYILKEHDLIQGVVTADADGQHTVQDIVQIAQALQASPRFFLGSRSFEGNVPFRSYLGNSITRMVFFLLSGCRVKDTQSGLRGFPRQMIPELLTLDGDRYEFEMIELAYLCRQGILPIEIPIETVYIEGNRASHFNPLIDSIRIYFVLLRFYLTPFSERKLKFSP